MAIDLDAEFGICEFGLSHIGYSTAWPWVATVNGSSVPVRRQSVLITETLGQPNTATLTIESATAPTRGHEVVIGFGHISNVIFAGRIVETILRWDSDRTTSFVWDLVCVDFTRDLTKRLVLKSYAEQSATAVILDLVASYTSGLTTLHVAHDLPTLTGGIEFTNEPLDECLNRIGERIGGEWFVGYDKDVWFYLSDSRPAAATLELNAAQPWRNLAYAVSDAEVVTRAIVEGASTTTLTAVGETDVLPVESVSDFPNGTDRQVRVGAVVWDADDTANATESVVRWQGVPFDYVYNYDSLAGGSYGGNQAASGSWDLVGDQASGEVDDAVFFGRTVAWQDVECLVTTPAVWSVSFTYEYWNGSTWDTLDVTGAPDWGVIGYQTIRFDAPADWATTTVNSVSAYWVRMRLSAVTSITTRPAIGSARSSVEPGSTTSLNASAIVLPSAQPPPDRDQWLLVDGQWILDRQGFPRGFPASGVGSVQRFAPVGEQALIPVSLRGVASIQTDATIPSGSQVFLRITRNDTTAQTALAAAEGGDGIRETYLQDGRLSKDGCEALGDAILEQRASAIERATYETRDPNAKAGATVTINLASPAVSTTLRIQSVTIEDDGMAETGHPWRSVTCAPTTDNFYALLRRRERMGA